MLQVLARIYYFIVKSFVRYIVNGIVVAGHLKINFSASFLIESY